MPIPEFEEAYKDEYYIEDDKVYEYPHVEIKVASGQVHKRRFKTESQLDDFIKANLDHVKL
jgi:hypothetical protein